jgi:signal transduction histidine kinase
MKFTHRLTAGFGLVAAFALAMAGLFTLEFLRYERGNHLIFVLDQVHSGEQALQTSMLLELQAVEDSLERPDPVFTDRAREQARKTAAAMTQIIQAHQGLSRELDRLAFPRDRLSFFSRFQQDLKGYEQRLADIQSMVDLKPEADRAGARRLANELEERINSGFAEMEQSWSRDIGLVLAEIQQEKRRAGFVLLLLAGGAFAVSLGFAVSLAAAARSLIRRLGAGMRRVAAGDYSRPVPLGSDPEINDLVEKFNRMAADLKGLEEMRTDFVSMLSHDLKSPLAIIKMYAEALGASGGVDPQPLQAISRSADRLLRLVENFLDASRSDATRLELTLRPVRLEPLIKRVQQDGQVLALSHGVTVVADLPGTLPEVLADEEHLERALHNLVSNGVKYNRPQGTVTIMVRTGGDQVRVAVRDTGAGIGDADRQQLFAKYFRAERTRHIRGTGLGLAVTREIVRAHGSDLDVESEEGKGSTFSFALRRAPAADQQTA